MSDSRNIHWFSSRRVISKNTHGTGCTFSAAIAAFLAQGYKLVEATHLAKSYLFHAVEAGVAFQIGRGSGPLHHFFAHWRNTASAKMGHFLPNFLHESYFSLKIGSEPPKFQGKIDKKETLP